MTTTTPSELHRKALETRAVGKKYRKTALIEAAQWFKHGDHYAVTVLPEYVAKRIMGSDLHLGWCPTREGGHLVDPGDWIATGVEGEHWPIKPDIFAKTYELAAITAYQAAIGAEPVACPIAAGLKEIIKAGTSTDEFEQWEVFSKEAQIAKAMLANLTTPPSTPNAEQETWRDCPEDDERWSAGCDFALEQICKVLRVDPGSVNWDAATETLDGDVQATIANILDVGLGNDDWKDFVRAAALSPPTDRSGE